MTKAPVFALAMLMYVISVANAQQISSVEIIEYGIYTADITTTQQDSSALGAHNTVSNIRHAATTTTIPAQIGVHFGFRYRVNGSPQGEKVELKRVTIFPPAGLKSPKSPQTLQKNENTIVRSIGATSYTDYSFDDDWELVSGTWTIQLWHGERKLAEKAFTVTGRH